MPIPTESEVFETLSYHIRMAQENSATLAHLSADYKPLVSRMWLDVSESFRKTLFGVTKLAQGKMQ